MMVRRRQVRLLAVVLFFCLMSILPLNASAFQAELVDAIKMEAYSTFHLEDQKAILIENIRLDLPWASGTIVLLDPNVTATTPHMGIFLGMYDKKEQRWTIAFRTNPQFQTWLPDVPLTVFNETEKGFFSNPQRFVDGLALLSLPWPAHESRYMSQGPHNYNGGNVNPLSSLDFTGGSGGVYAAREGLVQVLCGGNKVFIDHGDGWQTGYYHLTALDPRIITGSFVQRGQYLGQMGTGVGCGGSATGNHVHFTLYKHSIPEDLDGKVIGGWIINGNCFIRNAETICNEGWVVSDGSIGSGTSSQLQATPNPIPASTILESSTIRWNTGGIFGQVYVSKDGAPEVLMTQGVSGVDSPSWFSPGSEYRFRLYGGSQKAILLKELIVRRTQSLIATPQRLPASVSLTSATIYWSTGDGSFGQVYVSKDGGAETLMSQGSYGVDNPSWFSPGSEYRFRLYKGDQKAIILGELVLRREQSLIATPTSIPTGIQGPIMINLYWSTGDGTVGQVYVSRDGAPDTLMSQGSSGHANPSWIMPGSRYRFRLYRGTSLLREIIIQ
ncbi:peptidase M23B (plasmid) [Herpetosiphon aurantiacus DSM 785]|uniref:Peptidase M23B n=1 Tax=Herpetosiphon aurantiacus (strain ATCC 23779 / DSM 785 / 114-95) TaxID=316274 RepID=A9B9A3_HERA2|nr:peptidase M23B [Herpetosiphon aurantiacus DSM 785]